MSLEYALSLPTPLDTLKYLGEQARSKFQRGEDLKLGERHLLNIAAFLAEVRNGGLDQFFWNSTGDHTHETITALYAIGARATGDLLVSALELFPGQVAPEDRIRRCELLAKNESRCNEHLTNLNQALSCVREDYVSLLYKYVSGHKNDFA